MSLATDNDVRLLAVAICAMPNPPVSWDDAMRIAQWLMVQRIVNTAQETDPE
jgi:hypothetical protein